MLRKISGVGGHGIRIKRQRKLKANNLISWPLLLNRFPMTRILLLCRSLRVHGKKWLIKMENDWTHQIQILWTSWKCRAKIMCITICP